LPGIPSGLLIQTADSWSSYIVADNVSVVPDLEVSFIDLLGQITVYSSNITVTAMISDTTGQAEIMTGNQNTTFSGLTIQYPVAGNISLVCNASINGASISGSIVLTVIPGMLLKGEKWESVFENQ
jgi:hypothetical protein